MSDKEKSIDTSISGYSNIGIRLSEKQLFDLDVYKRQAADVGICEQRIDF